VEKNWSGQEGQGKRKPAKIEVELSFSNSKKKETEGLPVIGSAKIKTLKRRLDTKVFGQEIATQAIQDNFEMAFLGLNDPDRPRGSFLFVGDTGVGKTLAVKEIARHFWGEKWRDGVYIINGSEHMAEHEVSKLLGSPPGYVGHEEGSPFMKHITDNPESLVLFDEFEKAHSNIQDFFLQILDEGIAKDNKGENVDFRKSFIVLTSNIGTKEVFRKNPLGFCGSDRSHEAATTSVMSALERECRPEFLKRLDGVIVFNQLTDNDYMKICKYELSRLKERLSAKSIGFDYSREVVPFLFGMMEEGDTARDLNRIVAREVTQRAAKVLLENDNVNRVQVTVKNGVVEVVGT
jgi:ATP-dependent Clp protease ATP-binding subunit ClpA